MFGMENKLILLKKMLQWNLQWIIRTKFNLLQILYLLVRFFLSKKSFEVFFKKKLIYWIENQTPAQAKATFWKSLGEGKIADEKAGGNDGLQENEIKSTFILYK